MKKTNARHQSASRTINRFNPDNEQTALNEAGPLWGRGTVRQKRMECGKGTEMTGELTKRSFEVPALLERHNAFEQEVCRTVFQDKYSSSVKTYHVIDHLVSRGEELELMDVPSYLAAIEALKRFSSYHAGLIRGFAGERRDSEIRGRKRTHTQRRGEDGLQTLRLAQGSVQRNWARAP